MGIIIGIIAVAFLVGLVSRNKGDNFLDTLGSGCGTIIGIIVILAIVAVAVYYFIWHGKLDFWNKTPEQVVGQMMVKLG